MVLLEEVVAPSEEEDLVGEGLVGIDIDIGRVSSEVGYGETGSEEGVVVGDGGRSDDLGGGGFGGETGSWEGGEGEKGRGRDEG